MKVIASQMSCGGHADVSSCGIGAAGSAVEDEHRHGEADEARRFGEGEAEKERAALTAGGGRIAKRAGEIVAEDVPDADAGAPEGDRGDACADHPCCFRVHFSSPVRSMD